MEQMYKNYSESFVEQWHDLTLYLCLCSKVDRVFLIAYWVELGLGSYITIPFMILGELNILYAPIDSLFNVFLNTDRCETFLNSPIIFASGESQWLVIAVPYFEWCLNKYWERNNFGCNWWKYYAIYSYVNEFMLHIFMWMNNIYDNYVLK